MILLNAREFSMYCGDASDGLDQHIYMKWRGEFLLDKREFVQLQKKILLHDVMFLNQVHGIQGMAVTPLDRVNHSFITQGDFLITNQSGFGIGMMTADCMPIACYDPRTHSIGIAHAGWRGLIAGVVPAMILALKNNYGTCEKDLVWWVGPCARVCCYEVGADFMDNISPADQKYVMHQKDGKWFFDSIAFLRRQLAREGVADLAIDTHNALCTLCNARYCSYRRTGKLGESTTHRNMTVIVLSE